MLFLIHWELNEAVSPQQRIAAMNRLISAELYPPQNLKVLRFDITPADWGVSLLEANSTAAVMTYLGAWRVACPGIFKSTKVSPAIPVQESIAEISPIIEKLT